MISVGAECRRILYLSTSFMLIINLSHCIRDNIKLPKIPHHLINLQDPENYEPPQNEPIYSLYKTIIKKDHFSNQTKHEHLVFYEYLEYVLTYITDIDYLNFINANNTDEESEFLLHESFGLLSHEEYKHAFNAYTESMAKYQEESFKKKLNLFPDDEEECPTFVKRTLYVNINICGLNEVWFDSLKKSSPLPYECYGTYNMRNIKLGFLPVSFEDIYNVYQIEEYDNFHYEVIEDTFPPEAVVIKFMYLIFYYDED